MYVAYLRPLYSWRWILCFIIVDKIIGASLSKPHIDEFAVNFPYISLYLSIYRTSCRKSLPARILRVIASCVNSNHKRTHHCNVNDLDRDEP